MSSTIPHTLLPLSLCVRPLCFCGFLWSEPRPTMQSEFSSVQSLSRVWHFATPWTAACQTSLTITNSQNLYKLISIALVTPSNHLILCRPLLLLPSIFPSVKVFSNELDLHIRWPKYWCFSFSISPSNIWWCPCVESSLVLLEDSVCYDQCILLAKLC